MTTTMMWAPSKATRDGLRPTLRQHTADGAPTGGLDEGRTIELLEKTIASAVLAPSSHNTQPWLFQIRWGALELHLDRSRALPVADPACRELTISCGAALQNIRVALRHWGFAGRIEVLPYASNPDVLARVLPGVPHTPSSRDELLYRAIPRRHTSRAPYIAAPIRASLVATLQHAAEGEGVWLRPVADGGLRSVVAELIAAGDRRQWADRAFRRELAEWMRPNDGATRDGMPGYAFGLSAVASRLAPTLLRWVPRGRAQAARDCALALDAPLLAVLGTSGDGPRDWLAAGQALQRMLLLAAAHGMSASFLNQPVQLPALRARLRTLIGGTGFPQVVLRMGYGPQAGPTPRRAVRDVLDPPLARARLVGV